MPGPIRKPLFHPTAGTVINPEAVDIFAKGVRRIQRLARVGKNRWYDRQLLGYSSELMGALRLKPWERDPLDVVGFDRPWSWLEGELELADWRHAMELRDQLLAATRMAGRKAAAEPSPAA